MSYCVNCGVELAPSERVCPLCGTEAVNPRQPFDKAAPKPFPARLDIFAPTDNRGFLALVVTIVLCLPAAVCLACDAAYTHGAGWSMLVAGAMALLWVFIVPAMYVRRHAVLILGVLDTAAVLGYLWMIEHFAARGPWLVQLALPLVLLVDFLFAADYFLMARAVSARLRRAALAVATVPLFLVGLEVCLDRYLDGRVSLSWSFIVSVPCLLFALLLVVLDRRERFKREMRKRLHM
ncbi:MAG TPA: zinc ribbon domain-containing protein [Firmicutes bacterium]|nr:zinc ribbon domain-containing protein [Bacillota bacterium]